jgi:hypothetical protein
MKSKKRFIAAMTALKSQYDKDIAYANDVSKVLVVDMSPYNNLEVVKLIVDELSSWFDNPEDAKDEINRFMYEQNFQRDVYLQEMVLPRLWNKLNMPWIEHVELTSVPITIEQKAILAREIKLSYESVRPFNFMLDESGQYESGQYEFTTGMHNSDPFGNYHNYEKSQDNG